MKNTFLLLVGGAALAALFSLTVDTPRAFGSNPVSPIPSQLDCPAARLAERASKGVGTVDHAFGASSGSPIIVLEELHNSRASQIQHAITLFRLHQHDGLRHIGLEGYLKERPSLTAGWFTHRWKHQTPIQNARVAIRLLKEGEISEAEFMKLVFDDVALDPIEIGAQYNVNLKTGAIEGMLTLAQKVDPEVATQMNASFQQAASQPISAGEQLRIAEELERKRVSRHVQLSPQDAAGWQSWLGFWRGRAGGNLTMVNATLAVAKAQTEPVAMIVGGAHTTGVSALLVENQRSFAVVTPLAFKNGDKRGDIDKNYDRKDRRESVQSSGMFMTSLLRATGAKKPEPVITPVPWMEAKGNIYQNIDAIANGILGPPPPPDNGNHTYGFGSDDFNTALVRVNPARIIYLADDHHRRTVLFPITVVGRAGRPSTQFWVKAALGVAATENVDAIEDMLKKALNEVQAEQDAPSKAENAQGEIQVSTNTVAFIATDEKAARDHVLTGS